MDPVDTNAHKVEKLLFFLSAKSKGFTKRALFPPNEQISLTNLNFNIKVL